MAKLAGLLAVHAVHLLFFKKVEISQVGCGQRRALVLLRGLGGGERLVAALAVPLAGLRDGEELVQQPVLPVEVGPVWVAPPAEVDLPAGGRSPRPPCLEEHA